MKKSRTLIIALLLVATLCVGIGYAGFSSRMAINGEAILPGVQESEVVFTDAEKTAGEDYVTLTVRGQDSNSLTVNVSGFKFVGDSITVVATIENPHAFEVTIGTPVVKFIEQAGTQVDTSDYFTVEVDDAPTSIGAATDAETPATETLTFTVTATDITASATTQNFVISFIASAA